MHLAILTFPSEMTYDGELTTTITAEDRNLLEKQFPFPFLGHPRVFCVCRGDERQPPGQVSRSNEPEAKLVAEIFDFLFQRSKFPP